MVDVLAFVALGFQAVGGFFGDADADGVSALGGRATGGKFVGATHLCNRLTVMR